MGIPIFLSNIAVQSSYSKQAMTLQILNRQNSLLNTFLNEIRNVELQNDRMRFRRNLERVGEIMAYEISKTFSYVLQTIETPINPAEVNLPARDIVIATVLRAGLPFHQGFLNYFDRAESAFISARRAYNRTQETMEVRFDSIYTPRLDGKILLLVDPMLATGGFVVSFACNFFLTNYYTFKTKVDFENGVRFSICQAINFFMQYITLKVFIAIGVPEKVALIPVWAIIFPVNFWLMRSILRSDRFRLHLHKQQEEKSTETL